MPETCEGLQFVFQRDGLAPTSRRPYNADQQQKEVMAMERIELSRDCEAIQIPAGNSITLEKGVQAFITQSLGGTYTLQVPAYGGLFRVLGKDADALGKSPHQ